MRLLATTLLLLAGSPLISSLSTPNSDSALVAREDAESSAATLALAALSPRSAAKMTRDLERRKGGKSGGSSSSSSSAAKPPSKPKSNGDNSTETATSSYYSSTSTTATIGSTATTSATAAAASTSAAKSAGNQQIVLEYAGIAVVGLAALWTAASV